MTRGNDVRDAFASRQKHRSRGEPRNDVRIVTERPAITGWEKKDEEYMSDVIEHSGSSPCSPLAGAVRRLRMVDSYGIDWVNILRDPDTDPQMMRDVQLVVRQQIMLDKSGFFLAFDNSEPPQLWVFRGDPTDECAEPWQRVNF